MSAIDLRALESNFTQWKAQRAPTLTESKAFEIYSIEQILKDADLSDDDMRAGHFGGGYDGGIDGMFFFINRVLILDETPLPDPARIQSRPIRTTPADSRDSSQLWGRAVPPPRDFQASA